MNNKQRRAIKALYAKIESLKEEIDDITENERQAYENLPESIKDGWRGDAILGAIEALQEANIDLDNVTSSLVEATEFKA